MTYSQIKNDEWIFFIDESGNAGDIVPIFSDGECRIEQPIFSLASIGFPKSQVETVTKTISELKSSFKIGSNELKAKSLYTGRQEFILSIVKYLRDEKLPVFVEVNDKRYFLVAKITDLIFDEVPHGSMKQYYSEALSDLLDDPLLLEFSDVCRNRTEESFTEFIERLEDHLYEIEPDGGILYGFMKGVRRSYEKAKRENPNAHERLLPLPDYNLRGEPISLLPHVPALANMVARINQYTNENNISNYTIIHDEQRQFKQILTQNIEDMKNFDEETLEFVELMLGSDLGAKFRISNDVKVEFDRSDDNIGIQLADLIAGTVMRSLKEMELTESISDLLHVEILRTITSFHDEQQSLGINLVLPERKVSQFQSVINGKAGRHHD